MIWRLFKNRRRTSRKMLELVLVFITAVFMTLLIEFPFYWFGKYRDKLFVLGFLLINIATNLAVNTVIYWFVYRSNLTAGPLSLFLSNVGKEEIVLFVSLEITVFLIEYMVLSQLASRGTKLFLTVFFANLTSAFLGTVLLWLIF